MNTFTYNINGIKICMHINKPYSKLNPYLSCESDFDIEFHVGYLSDKAAAACLSTKFKHKVSSWQIQLIDFDGAHTVVYFKGDRFFSRMLFYTMVFEALLQYKYSQKGIVTLHASSVSDGVNSFAFSGDATVGKTSILLHLLSRGYGYLADDQTVIAGCTLKILPYILPVGVDLHLTLRTGLSLSFNYKLRLLLATVINKVFFDYTAFTPMIYSDKLVFAGKHAVLGKPAKIGKIFVLENADRLSVTKLSPEEAYSKLWRCKFGSKSRLPALIYYGEEYRKVDKDFMLWSVYKRLLFDLTRQVPVYRVCFSKTDFDVALKLILREMSSKGNV